MRSELELSKPCRWPAPHRCPRAPPCTTRNALEDRAVRRQLLLRPLGHQGAGAVVGEAGRTACALARMADDAGIDFMLPIARWKGYGGDTDFHGATLETITWAAGPPRRDVAHDGVRHRPCAAVPSADRRQGTGHRRPYRRGPSRGQSGGRLERGRVRDVRRRAARARHALRLRAGMARCRQARLERAGRRSTWRVDSSSSHKRAGVSEAVRRHAADHHERRLLAGRPGFRAAQLRRLLHRDRRLANLARRKRPARGGDQGPRGRIRPRHRGLHGRPGGVPRKPAGGRGLLPPRHHRQCRLGRGRTHDGVAQHHAAEFLSRTNMRQNVSISPATPSAATRSSARPTRWRRSWRGSAMPGFAALRCPSWIISANCRISAPRCCRDWCNLGVRSC